MAILKKEYEISIWNEYLDSDGKKVEVMGAIIGSHDMSYFGRVINPVLKRELKGTNTLTFDMVEKFFDPKKGEFVKNELTDMLYNEQKVKLHYGGKWYEFYIKNISESKNGEEYIKSYSCTDSFIEELSRTGYGITFDAELNNNVSEIGDFMEEILDDSVWDYRADFNSGDFTEFKEERCYKIPLSVFGGSISAYPIDLKVNTTAYNYKSSFFKEANSQKEVNAMLTPDFTDLKNIYTGKTRILEMGDDTAREREIFWDPYYKDNGFKLLDGSKKVTLTGDYIYVPYSYLSFIYGSIYQESYKATEEPAYYGPYGTQLGFALQPSSKNPKDLVQFLFFNNNDEVLIDEEGYIANNDHHYIIPIQEWNEALRANYVLKGASPDYIHWRSPRKENGILTSKYKIQGENEIYTVNVRPNSSTVDDFDWYPVYYEGYLEKIGDTEVYGARNISITDRTEYNLAADYYTTVYNNTAKDYKGMYSEKEMETIIDTVEPRVQSKVETRIITPTLARNLIQNGEHITKPDGWESLTQNKVTEFETGSYANLLTISTKATSDKDDIEDGDKSDESINDYYLEFLSPNIAKCNDIDYEGKTSVDYALNFGMSAKDIKIEKDKVYAIRISTGTWVIDSYNIQYRNATITDEKTYTKEEVEVYKKTIKDYFDSLKNLSIDGLEIDTSTDEYQKRVNDMIEAHDKDKTELFEKFSSVTLDTDYNYIVYKVFKEKDKLKEIPKEKKDVYVELPENEHEVWQNSSSSENRTFGRHYNLDLDKVIIGKGSIDINGNYVLSGTKENSDTDDYISFADIFEEVEDGAIRKDPKFLPYSETNGGEIQDLTTTFYHCKDGNTWSWHKMEDNFNSDVAIEDYPYLLFKAKSNITTPYVGIKVESEPMTFKIESTQVESYAETNKSGVKIEVFSKDEANDDYLVNNANIAIYKVDSNNFSKEFLQSVGWDIENSSESSISDSKFTFYTKKDKDSYVNKGTDVSYCQKDLVDGDKLVTLTGDFSDFMIIRVSYGVSSKDSYAPGFVKSCIKSQKPFGFYHYYYADKNNSNESAANCVNCIDAIKAIYEAFESDDEKANFWKYFQYPVFLDYEESNLFDSKENVQQKCKTFTDGLKAEGLYPGLYMSASPLKQNFSDTTYLDDMFIWMAHHNTSDPYSVYTGHREIWQSGLKTDLSFAQGMEVDINYGYVKPVENLHKGALGTDTVKNDSEDTTPASLMSNEPIVMAEENSETETTTTTSNTIDIASLNIVSPKTSLVNRYNVGRNGEQIQKIVIHSVGSATEDPQVWGDSWNKGNNVSAHYVVGPTSTVQYVQDKDKAWHAGGANSTSIGIEQSEPGCLEYDNGGIGATFSVPKDKAQEAKEFLTQIFNRTAKLTAYLCQKYNLQPNDETILFHGNISGEGGHCDPMHVWGEITNIGSNNKKIYGRIAETGEDFITGLTTKGFIEKVKEFYSGGGGTDSGSSGGNDPVKDRYNRENPNNDYTLKDGHLLSTAKPCWMATSFEDVATYCCNISPKNGDFCSLAYALFVNGLYYGIFWLEEKDKTIIKDKDTPYIEPDTYLNIKIVQLVEKQKDPEEEEGGGQEYTIDDTQFIPNVKFKIEALDKDILFSPNNIKDDGSLSEDKKTISFVTKKTTSVVYNLANGKYRIVIEANPKVTTIEGYGDFTDISKDEKIYEFEVLDGSIKTDGTEKKVNVILPILKVEEDKKDEEVDK